MAGAFATAIAAGTRCAAAYTCRRCTLDATRPGAGGSATARKRLLTSDTRIFVVESLQTAATRAAYQATSARRAGPPDARNPVQSVAASCSRKASNDGQRAGRPRLPYPRSGALSAAGGPRELRAAGQWRVVRQTHSLCRGAAHTSAVP